MIQAAIDSESDGEEKFMPKMPGRIYSIEQKMSIMFD